MKTEADKYGQLLSSDMSYHVKARTKWLHNNCICYLNKVTIVPPNFFNLHHLKYPAIKPWSNSKSCSSQSSQCLNNNSNNNLQCFDTGGWQITHKETVLPLILRSSLPEQRRKVWGGKGVISDYPGRLGWTFFHRIHQSLPVTVALHASNSGFSSLE